MRESMENNALFRASHMMILAVYTVMGFALIGEIILMSWEYWAIIPILLAIGFSWFAHIQQLFTDRHRLLLYVLCMELTSFFYGIHLSSAFDLALLMSVVIMLCTTTGIRFFITMSQVTFFVTFAYDIINIATHTPEALDSLTISRIALHSLLILLAGGVARIVIDRWYQVMSHSQEEVKELAEATGRLNDFLTSVSHEIRTPINAVIGLSGICLEHTEEQEQREHLKAVQAAGKRMTELISDVLDYSEVDRNNCVVNPEDYILSSVLHDLAAELVPYMRKGVELIIDVDPAIPAVMNTDVAKLKKILWHLTTNALKFTKEGGIYVRISSEAHDYGINLLLDVFDTGIGMTDEEVDHLFDGFYQADSSRTRSNGGLGLGMAIVYGFVTALDGFIRMDSTPGAGTTVHVCLPQKVVDPSSCMSVRDRENLVIGGYLNFEKYPNPAVRDYYNTMVRNIVRGLDVKMHRVDNLENLKKLLETIRLTHLFVGEEEYKADIAYMERLAETVTVTVVADASFVLPVGSKAHIMEKPFYCFPVAVVLNREPGDDPADQYIYCEGVRALVVDDEPLNLTVARDILRRYGITTTTAPSGQAAIDLCARESYDIIFMDHMMPGMDGIEAMRRIRANGFGTSKTVPIVALTANASSTARESFRISGFDGFIPKPIDLKELERVLRAVLPKNMITYESAPRERTERKERPAAAALPASPAPAPADGYAPLRAVGVDIRQGLRYCQNDEEFYRTVLRQFASEAGGKRAEMERFFRDRDLANYSILVHALKSTAKMIGASGLSERAKALEEASKADSIGEVQAGHSAAMSEYEALTQAIFSAVGGESAPEDGETADGETEDDALEFAPEQPDVLEFTPEPEASDTLDVGPEEEVGS